MGFHRFLNRALLPSFDAWGEDAREKERVVTCDVSYLLPPRYYGQALPPLQEEDDQVPGGGGVEAEQHDDRAVVVPRGGGPSET